MMETYDLIAKKLVNALIPDAEARTPIRTRAVISRFQKHYGGLWVGGTLYLRIASIEFHPNALNRAVHTGDMRRMIMLQDIVDVKDRFGVLTGITDLTCRDRSIFSFRCFGAKRFAERIRQQLLHR
jgi:hypothetical protein